MRSVWLTQADPRLATPLKVSLLDDRPLIAHATSMASIG